MHAISLTMETTASSGTEFVSVPLLLVKDEPNDDPEMADTNFNLADSSAIAETDPMNLLDPMNGSNPTDPNSLGQPQLSSGPTKEIWQAWMAEFPWLLHEDEDDHYGYCLYCNNKISYKICKTPIQHAQTRNHRENEENYLAFKESEEHANMSASSNGVTIKQEFGTDSNISAIKFKRMSQTEPFFNFNWRRWQLQHPWLERDNQDITYGCCKFCKIRLHIEYSYMRMRHETCFKHRLAVSNYNKQNATSIVESSNDAAVKTTEQPNEESNVDKDPENTGQSSEEEAPDGDARRSRRGYMKHLWFEIVKHSNPRTARCKLCNVKMSACNFHRHLRSQVHMVHERNFKEKKKIIPPNVKQEFQIKPRNWKIYAKKHPWLIGDPDDPSFAYCKYCKKRLHYGIHPLKRLAHERSINHNNALKASKLNDTNPENKYENSEAEINVGEEHAIGQDNSDGSMQENDESEAATDNENDSDGGGENNEDAGDNDDDNGGDDNEDQQANKSKNSRFTVGSDEWFAMFPWCKRYNNDSKYMYCSYCKTKLKTSFRRKQHERTTRHKEAAKAINSENNLSHFQHCKQNKRIKYHSWLVYTQNQEYIFCKYCRIRLLNSASRTKHARTKRHIESEKQFLANENRKKTPNKTVTSPAITTRNVVNTPAPKPVTAITQRSMKSKVTMWKNRFPWLTYKLIETQPNYGYCKFCEMRVYVPTDKFAMKHQKSLKHVRVRIQLKRQNIQAKKAELEKQKQQTSNQLAGARQNELSIKYPWMVPDKQDVNYGHCQYCDVRLNITGILKDRHEATIKHHKAEIEYFKEKKNEEKEANERVLKEKSDVVVVEDDAGSVKSEPMDEDDVLNYLLKRSADTSKRDRATDAAESTADSLAKRQKISEKHETTLIERARRLTTAHLEILRLSRDLNDSNKSSKKNDQISLPSSLFNTSAAIAAILSPQQQAPVMPPPPVTTPTRNNFELFFDSVCESVKTLPSDLAAEGKIKIAQLVADLELRALQRTQSKDLTNSSPIQAGATQIAITSPTLSGADMPSTTTNGLEKDETISATPPAAAESAAPASSSSSYSFDTNLRIIPISSTPNNRHSDANMHEISVRRRTQPLHSTPQQQHSVVETSFKRVHVNPVLQQAASKVRNNESFASSSSIASRSNVYSSEKKPTAAAFVSHTQNRNVQAFSPPAQKPFQQRTYTQQFASSSSVEGGGSQQFALNNPILPSNTQLTEGGFRRIHLSSRPNQTSKEMGFRRIHIPIKGANAVTNTVPKTGASGTYYINHSNNN